MSAGRRRRANHEFPARHRSRVQTEGTIEFYLRCPGGKILKLNVPANWQNNERTGNTGSKLVGCYYLFYCPALLGKRKISGSQRGREYRRTRRRRMRDVPDNFDLVKRASPVLRRY